MHSKRARLHVQSGPEKNCTKFNAPSLCNRLQQNRAVFCFEKNAQKLTVNTKNEKI